MPTATATYDHATAVANILAGYYRTEMALRRAGQTADSRDKPAEATKADRASGAHSARPS